jgi:hypothetical protein
MFRSAQHDNYLNPIHGHAASNVQSNHERSTNLDKGGNRWRLLKKGFNDMNNNTTYALLTRSEEKGRSIMETAVYIMCILSVAVAIFQFIGQPVPDPFAGFDAQAQPTPVVSHHAAEPVLDTKS